MDDIIVEIRRSSRRLRVLSILFPALVVTLARSQPSLPTVAVLDFEGRGISQVEAATLTDRLTTELGITKAVILVERKQLEKILEEQGFQQAGCTSQECVAKVGQLLGVQFMVAGSINRIGSSYTVDAKMFSVETGVNVKTVSKTHKGQIDELLPLMEAVAWELVELDKRRLETVAVLDFEGRGISQLEAATLTDRFTSSLGKTGAILLVARQEMQEILAEQGFKQQEGCTSVECAAEVGALIGVKNIVNGAIGKVGETYTIDAQMIRVSTGATVRTVNKTYAGRIDGLITEIEIMAWEIADLDPPAEMLRRQRTRSPVAEQSRPRTRTGAVLRSVLIPGYGQLYSGKKVWGWTWMAAEVLALGLVYKSSQDYLVAERNFNKYSDLYHAETELDLVYQYKGQAGKYYDRMSAVNNQFTLYAGLAGGIWLASVLQSSISGPESPLSARQVLFFAFSQDRFQVGVCWQLTGD